MASGVLFELQTKPISTASNRPQPPPTDPNRQALNRELEDANADLSERVKRVTRAAAAAGVSISPSPPLAAPADGKPSPAANGTTHTHAAHHTPAAQHPQGHHNPQQTPVQHQDAMMHLGLTPGGESVADNAGLATPARPFAQGRAPPPLSPAAAAYQAVADGMMAANGSPAEAPSAASRAAPLTLTPSPRGHPDPSGSAEGGAFSFEGDGAAAGGLESPSSRGPAGRAAQEAAEDGGGGPARSQGSRNSNMRQWSMFSMLAGRRGSPVS
jgi:hypothetical protein